MANIAEFKNPLRAEKINALNPMDYISGIGFVAWAGIITVLGAKLLVAADKYIPGNITPNNYKTISTEPTTDSGVTVL